MSIRNYAQEVYRSDSLEPLVNTPRQRFNFNVEISTVDALPVLFERVKSASVPGFNFDTQLVNQYNRKRVVQSKVNYEPIVITFYDTFDNSFHNLLKRYMRHYYHSTDGIDVIKDMAAAVSVDLMTNPYGYTLVDDSSERYFLDNIKIRQFGMAGESRLTVAKKCLITDIRADTLDYSDSNPVEFTVTFQPEVVQSSNTPDRNTI